MKFVDEYRHPTLLHERLTELRRTATRRWAIMDVCGGQTHSLLKHGLEEALADTLDLIHGPGCPVCVTPAEAIDDAIQLSEQPNIVLTSFGDMLRVPGGRGSLLQARAAGADVRTVYSPVDAVRIAREEAEKQIVFFGVGFETTAPATALAVLQAQHLGIKNFSVLVHHVRVEPAMRAILEMPDNRIQGFLAAGHVCTVTGYGHYCHLVDQFQVPIVVTGFEPLDLLDGLYECVRLLESASPKLANAYARSASLEGNRHAQRLIDNVYQIATVPWRGFGTITDGGLVMRDAFRQFDARHRFGLVSTLTSSDGDCRSGDVMSGRIKPPDCPLFGKACTPDSPVGAPMVSSEGICTAYFRYAHQVEVHHG
jgi:hydrogenase expression/formation protein HypD